jgi:monoamine oxidase
MAVSASPWLAQGIAGLSAAYLAHRNGHDVTLFERGDVCGGHALTVDSSVGPVDLGFQVRAPCLFFFVDLDAAEKNHRRRRAPSIATFHAPRAFALTRAVPSPPRVTRNRCLT